jgi:hypothetical protein
MCGLCGMLGGEVHWTDRAGSADERAAARVMTSRAERFQRVALMNAVLGHYGLALTDWQGSSYLLSNRTGRTEIVADLASRGRHARAVL